MYQLKKGQETFQIVDGPDEGLTFERNKTYDQAPKGYENRFEPVATEPAPIGASFDPDPAPPVKTTKTRKGDEQ